MWKPSPAAGGGAERRRAGRSSKKGELVPADGQQPISKFMKPPPTSAEVEAAAAEAKFVAQEAGKPTFDADAFRTDVTVTA
jgi:hypothetical protein